MQYGALHPESRAFLGSWNALSGRSGEEDKQNVLGKDALGIVDRIFLAQRASEGVFTFKTIGDELKHWTGRELRDHDVASLFHGTDRPLIAALLEAAVSMPGPALARVAAFGVGHGQRSEVELVFLPLIEQGQVHRILGLFQPISGQNRMSKPILRFSLTALLPPTPEPPARQGLRLVSSRS